MCWDMELGYVCIYIYVFMAFAGAGVPVGAVLVHEVNHQAPDLRFGVDRTPAMSVRTLFMYVRPIFTYVRQTIDSTC